MGMTWGHARWHVYLVGFLWNKFDQNHGAVLWFVGPATFHKDQQLFEVAGPYDQQVFLLSHEHWSTVSSLVTG